MMTLGKRFGRPNCLLLCQIPTKTFPGLFNPITQFLIFNITNRTKYMRVKAVQLKQDNTMIGIEKYREFLFARMDIASSQFGRN
jgi:hypothetical protein